MIKQGKVGLGSPGAVPVLPADKNSDMFSLGLNESPHLFSHGRNNIVMVSCKGNRDSKVSFGSRIVQVLLEWHAVAQQ